MMGRLDWIRLYADSCRPGLCPDCGRGVLRGESPNGRPLALEPSSRPEQRDLDPRSRQWILSFARRDLHRLTCPVRAAFRLPRRRRPVPGQIDLFVDV
jgi:hypothetical protein